MKYVISLSGGMDSATLAYKLKAEGHELKALSFNYDQRHKRELECARAIAEKLEIEHQAIDVSFLKDLLPGSSLTDDSVATPEGHYAQENMKLTVVPNRNMIFTSILAGHAVAIGYDGIALGVHAGDHFIYFDCREAFLEELREAICLGNDRPVFQLLVPFLNMGKDDICLEGSRLGVPYELTHTCYNPQGDLACGKCGSCNERLEAFAKNNLKDPIGYV